MVIIEFSWVSIVSVWSIDDAGRNGADHFVQGPVIGIDSNGLQEWNFDLKR